MGTDSSTSERTDNNQPTVYQIRIAGRLSPSWQSRFEGMTLEPGDNSDTTLTGPVADQAALHGLLRKVRDLGLPLISINEIDPQRQEAQDPSWIQDCQNGMEDDA